MARASRAAALMVGLAATLALASPAQACTCTEWPDFAEAFAASDAVFRGTVTAIEPAGAPYFEMVWVTFAVGAWWKGEQTATETILTGMNEAVCGYEFALGSEYLVYAPTLPWAGELYTHLCWRTHAYFAADPDLVALGPPLTVAVAERPWSDVKRTYR